MVNNELVGGGFRVLPGGIAPRSSVRNWVTGIKSGDVDCVKAAAAGDQLAFAYLFETRFPKISGYVQNILLNTAETEETVADVFVTAWRKLGKLHRPERFDAWLFRIAHNHAMDSLRKKKATVPLEDSALQYPDPDPHHSPEGSLEMTAHRQLIQTALLQLSEDQREVLTLRYLVGMSHAEVALQLNKSVEAIRALQSRGIRQLRAMIS